MRSPVLAFDQGATSSRAIVFDETLQVASVSRLESPQSVLDSGWGKHDPEDLWRTSVATALAVIVAPSAR